MKYIKKIIIITMVCVLSMQVGVMASDKIVTKSTDMVTVKLKYTSYKTKKGVKKVKNGKVVSVKGKTGFLYIWQFVPKKTTLSLNKDGTKYIVKVQGIRYNNYATQPQVSYKLTETLTFGYR